MEYNFGYTKGRTVEGVEKVEGVEEEEEIEEVEEVEEVEEGGCFDVLPTVERRLRLRSTVLF